jgi:hypothetical protein
MLWQQAPTVEEPLTSFDEPSVGELLRVYGRLGEYKGQRQLTVASLARVADANAETLHWLDTLTHIE